MTKPQHRKEDRPFSRQVVFGPPELPGDFAQRTDAEPERRHPRFAPQSVLWTYDPRPAKILQGKLQPNVAAHSGPQVQAGSYVMGLVLCDRIGLDSVFVKKTVKPGAR